VIRKLISVLFLLLAGLSLYNVYGDGSGAQKLAEAMACGAGGCVRMLRAERTPVGQSFTFQTSLSPPQTQNIGCSRAYLFVGDFSCSPAAE
jgi:hypothetical protein